MVAGKASFSSSGVSRNPPSVTMPAQPRTIRREIRIEPAEAARGSLRLSITMHSARRALLDRNPLRVVAIPERFDRVQVLAGRHVAQRKSLADHRRGREG